jgi:hypothetical protein
MFENIYCIGTTEILFFITTLQVYSLNNRSVKLENFIVLFQHLTLHICADDKIKYICEPGMGEISKQRQLNKKVQHKA